jgi:ankyrin repeat protein
MRKQLILLITVMLMAGTPAHAGVYEDILLAANDGRTDDVVGLLRRGLDVNTTDRDGSTLLMIAARTGNPDLTEFLLNNRGSLERRNRFGDTALLLAVSQNQDAIVRRLVKAGAVINPEGWTPLHYAVHGNRLETARFLVAQGAKLDLRAPNGRTALMLATQSGHLDTVRWLLSNGADLTLKDFEGKSALDIAREKGFSEIAEYLKLRS